MAKYATSDTHFGHGNILRFDKRPWSDINQHDRDIVANFNDQLKPNDEIYHLGDVAFTEKAFFYFMDNIRKDVKIHLIRGNHDDKVAWRHRRMFASYQEALYVRHNGYTVYLSHYAMRVWRNSHHGSMHFFGHTHGSLDAWPWGRSEDVGVNVQDYRLVNFDDGWERLSVKEPVYHHPEEQLAPKT